MPNGTSGDFWLPVAQLRQVLAGIPGEADVGTWFGDLTPVTAAELIRCLTEFGDANLVVQEQDFSWFVVRLTTDINTFVAVPETSPLCDTLRSFHVPGSYNTSSQPEHAAKFLALSLRREASSITPPLASSPTSSDQTAPPPKPWWRFW
jgi:hypothetical protein